MPMAPENIQNSGRGNRNALGIPVMEDGLREWSYDLFDCFTDCRTCMCGLCLTTLVPQLTGDFSRPVLFLLLLCLLTEQAAI